MFVLFAVIMCSKLYIVCTCIKLLCSMTHPFYLFRACAVKIGGNLLILEMYSLRSRAATPQQKRIDFPVRKRRQEQKVTEENTSPSKKGMLLIS